VNGVEQVARAFLTLRVRQGAARITWPKIIPPDATYHKDDVDFTGVVVRAELVAGGMSAAMAFRHNDLEVTVAGRQGEAVILIGEGVIEPNESLLDTPVHFRMDELDKPVHVGSLTGIVKSFTKEHYDPPF